MKLRELNITFIEKLIAFYDKMVVYDIQKNVEQEKLNLYCPKFHGSKKMRDKTRFRCKLS